MADHIPAQSFSAKAEPLPIRINPYVVLRGLPAHRTLLLPNSVNPIAST
jgi:hypothetical protein